MTVLDFPSHSPTPVEYCVINQCPLRHPSRYFQAQVLYSIAVFNAPPASETSQELSLALGNRSACLQIGKFYEGALEDIQLSFDAGYPEGKR